MVAFRTCYWKRIIIAAALVLMLLPQSAFASQLDAKRSELQNVMTKIETNRSMQSVAEKRQAEILRDIQVNDQKIAQLQTELTNLQAELDKIIAKRKDTEAKLDEMQKKLEANQAELEVAQGKLAQRREVYNTRLRAIYKDGSLKVITVLLSSKSLADGVKRAVLISKIAENDGKLISEMSLLVQDISDKIGQIEDEKESIAKQQKYLVDEENRTIEVKNKIAARQKLFKDELSRQKAILARVQRERIQLERAEELLEATSNMITKEIRSIEKRELERKRRTLASLVESNPTSREPAHSKIGNGFIPPTAGSITSKFGWRFHPILKYYRLHAGIDFRASSGTPIHAARGGTVILAGWKGGYGNTVVISHGDGLTTLYAHNSRVAVRVGQHVRQGQVISYSGSTGLATGPHLHFEVRLNGNPVDPMGWLN
ncbi:MAG TPA: peptidoglycan DD-metalloendopeptidase family protein [Anaerolineae bacterium]|nr:peptidoglycan DD-metalloendopeptidase family protein [Anaerolineae bacterium]